MTLQNPLLPVPQEPDAGNRPAPAAGLTGGDVEMIRQALDHSVSDNTRAAYKSAWRSFGAWCRTRGALALPASPQLAAAYLTHLAEERRLSVTTVHLHKAAGHDDPTNNEGGRRVLQGIARAHGTPQKQARPRTSEALAAVRATAESAGLQPGLQRR